MLMTISHIRLSPADVWPNLSLRGWLKPISANPCLRSWPPGEWLYKQSCRLAAPRLFTMSSPQINRVSLL